MSYAIKHLEAELGTQLFARSKRKVALTPAGELFRERASQALQTLERAAENARCFGRGEAGRLVLRFTLTSALTFVPRALARFREAYPQVEIDVGPGGTSEQLEAIRAGRCDIGFIPYRDDFAPLASQTIERSPIVALLPAGHRFAKRRTLRLADLAPERFVFLKSDSEHQTRAYFRARCMAAGFAPNIVLEIDQLELLLAMVAANLGVSCAPDLVRSLRFPGLAIVPLKPVFHGGISAVWDPDGLAPAEANFLAMLRERRLPSEA